MVKKSLVGLLIVLLVASNVIWMYVFVDQATTVHYQGVSLDYAARDFELIEQLSSEFFGKKTISEVMELLKQRFGGYLIKQHGDSLVTVDNVGLRFREGQLKNFQLEDF